ncbi:TetR/AcrR family transcriptional regulator [Sedimenticola selenatireducens]|uniref:TetR family transcriptional regulator n=1 Tax=Sedimenticola selenatireducens TaxID=191960 RepID=A0A2N6CUZ0_9GAMM|nr:TetR/AcrR family transcriptional regulator [Sedimenticola selenatireducens]PLX60955.1 MAG: TetR family transcriptional regulator [Sedimenticola selenatireducens]
MPYLNKAAPSPEPLDCRILSAALDLFVERGFHNVSVHDVQRESQVSIGSIYKHFGGKEGIAKALYYHLLNEFEEMMNQVMEEDLSNRERCNRIIALLFEYTESRRNIIEYMLHAKHREFLPNEPPICSSTPFKVMRNIVQQGMDAGEIRSGNPWVVASTVFGGAIRMIHLRLDGVMEQPLTECYDELIDCMWRGLSTGEAVKRKRPQAVEVAG